MPTQSNLKVEACTAGEVHSTSTVQVSRTDVLCFDFISYIIPFFGFIKESVPNLQMDHTVFGHIFV